MHVAGIQKVTHTHTHSFQKKKALEAVNKSTRTLEGHTNKQIYVHKTTATTIHLGLLSEIQEEGKKERKKSKTQSYRWQSLLLFIHSCVGKFLSKF